MVAVLRELHRGWHFPGYSLEPTLLPGTGAAILEHRDSPVSGDVLSTTQRQTIVRQSEKNFFGFGKFRTFFGIFMLLELGISHFAGGRNSHYDRRSGFSWRCQSAVCVRTACHRSGHRGWTSCSSSFCIYKTSKMMGFCMCGSSALSLLLLYVPVRTILNSWLFILLDSTFALMIMSPIFDCGWLIDWLHIFHVVRRNQSRRSPEMRVCPWTLPARA